MKAAFYTLGCKVNQYDTQMMSEKLLADGYSICSFDEVADIYIINTCTVTQISDKKSRNIISRAKKNNPDAVIVVCGCYSQVAPGETSSIDGVDIVIGTRNRKNILNYIKQFIKEKRQIVEVTNSGDLCNETITDFSEKTRAILKIEDGCRNFCSYCLIPYARGNIISKPIDQVVSEATSLSENGYKEIVLTGIHLSSYGKDLENTDLADAINEVSKVSGIYRIRLGSLEPTIITPEFIKKIENNNKLCHSFHLSLQSGCDKTLAAMNRKYTSKQYENAVALLRKAFPKCSVTTDIIVGFPGETDEDFNISKAFANKISFAKIHIFPYSVRKGTKAEKLSGHVEKSIKIKREKSLSEVELKCRKEFNKKLVGSTFDILVENCENGVCTGFTKNYVHTKFPGNSSLCNTIVNVTITDSDENYLFGELK